MKLLLNDEQRGQCGEGQERHHAARHDLLGFGVADGEEHEEEPDIGGGDEGGQDAEGDEGQGDGEGNGHDQRRLAGRLHKPDHAAEDEKAGVDPEDKDLSVAHGGADWSGFD